MLSEYHQIDEQRALDSLDGNRKLLMELSQMFSEDAPILLKHLQTLLEQRNMVAARSAIRSLKGLSSTFFVAEFTALANQLEREAAAGRMELLVLGMNDLEFQLNQLLQEIRARGWSSVPPIRLEP